MLLCAYANVKCVVKDVTVEVLIRVNGAHHHVLFKLHVQREVFIYVFFFTIGVWSERGPVQHVQ